MLKGIKSKLNDMSTIKFLCERAETYALQDQQREPGAEHFLLASLDHPDGTGRLAFDRAGVEPDVLKADALSDMPMSAIPGTYHAAPSGQEIMQELAATRKDHGPLLGAHVVGIVADMSQGVAARALRALGIDSSFLKSTADTIAEGGHAR